MEKQNLIEEMKAKILRAFKAEVISLAEFEGEGFVEAEYAQTMTDIVMPDHIVRYLENAERKGYLTSDFKVVIYTSTHSAWYNWIAFRIENEVLGVFNSDKVKFPNRNSYDRAFLYPLLERENKAKTEKTISDLKIKIEALESVIKAKDAKIEALKATIDDLISEDNK